jgi:hypothetical protein
MTIQPQVRQYPVRGVTYTLEQIMRDLRLRDSPALMVEMNTRMSCVQDSHLSEEELLSVPGFAQTKWRYVRETIEWIPVFHWADAADPLTFLDAEPSNDDPGLYHWITPKGFPREQQVG